MRKLSFVLLLLAAACGKKTDPTPAASAAFSTTRTVVETGEPVATVNTSTNAVSYTWLTDDGQTSSVATPSFTFANAGTHKITLTALNASGSATSVDHTVTVGTRFFTSLEVVDILIYTPANAPNLRIDFGPASAPTAAYLTPIRWNLLTQNLPLSYTQAYVNGTTTLLTLTDLPITRAPWLIVLKHVVSSSNISTIQSFTQDLTAPSANRDSAGIGWYDLINANSTIKLRVHYETRIQ